MNELKRHQDLIERMSKETDGGDNSDMEAEEEEETEQPEIKHKKFRHHAKRSREEEVISSSHVPEKAVSSKYCLFLSIKVYDSSQVKNYLVIVLEMI